ncbi:MAG TPA: caspase family protein [Candidatus Sulfopaludibacter sp.]|jgi:WD40 repeat protein|nr:caspase family protein [Candidatus Sulfopaludibacter sp.]
MRRFVAFFWLASCTPLAGQTADVTQVVFRGEDQLVSSSQDGAVRLWTTGGKLVRSIAADRDGVSEFALRPGSAELVAVGRYGALLWNLDTGAKLAETIGFRYPVYSRDGKTLLFASDSSVYFAELATLRIDLDRRSISMGSTGSPPVKHLVRSKDGRWVAIGWADGTVQVTDCSTEPPVVRARWKSGIGDMRTMAMNADGTRIALSSGASIQLWETPAGRKIGEIQAEAAVTALSFHPADGWLAAGLANGSIAAWNADSLTLLRRIPAFRLPPLSIAFSDSGSRMAAGFEQGAIAVWNQPFERIEKTWGGRPLSTVPTLLLNSGHASTISSLAYSRDGKWLASLSRNDGKVLLWDAAGRPLHSLPGSWRFAYDLAVSADSQKIAVVGENSLAVWNVAAWRKDSEVPLHREQAVSIYSMALAPDWKSVAFGTQRGTVAIVDVASGAVRQTLAAHQGFATALKFSSDGSLLASWGQDRRIVVWDAQSGRKLAELAQPKFESDPAFCFLTKSQLLVIGNGTPYLYDWQSAKDLRPLGPPAMRATALAVSPDGQTIAGGSNGGPALYSRAGLLRHARAATDDLVRFLQFSPDMRSLCASSWNDYQTGVWSLDSGQLTSSWQSIDDVRYTARGLLALRREAFSGRVSVFDPLTGNDTPLDVTAGPGVFLHLSPDGATVIAWNLTMLAAVDRSTGKIRWQKPVADYGVASFGFLGFSADGRRFLMSGSSRPDTFSDTLVTVETAGGRSLLRTPFATGPVPLALSPDGGSAAMSTIMGGYRVQVLDLARHTTIDLPGNTAVIRTIAFSADGRLVAAGDEGGGLVVWNLATKEAVLSAAAHSNMLEAITFAPDGRHLATAGRDGAIRFWSLDSAQPLATLIPTRGGRDWVAVASSGLFDGTPSGWNRVRWRFSDELFDVAPVESFFSDYYTPGLLGKLLSATPPVARPLEGKDRHLPDVTISAEANGENGTVQVSAKAASGGALNGVRLFRNGTLVKRWNAREPAAALTVEVPLVSGENRFSAYAFNQDNVKSEDALSIVTGPAKTARRPTLHLVTIGIDRYSLSSLNLKYAVADARAFAEEVQARQEKYEVRPIPLADETATREGIGKALRAVAGAARPEDVVAIFFAGHGITSGDQFYLLPHDVGVGATPANLASAGISDRDLEGFLESAAASQIVLVLDACNSGQAMEADDPRRGPLNSRGLGQLAYEKGMYILAASQSFATAKEHEALGHGALTYALVEEGLKHDAADRAPKDGSIRLVEWLEYALEEVPRLSSRETRDRGIKLDQPDTGAQIPQLYYRRDLPLADWEVARVKQ